MQFDWHKARAWVVIWGLLVGATIADELFAIASHNPGRPPLTQTIVHNVPWWVTMPFLAWLIAHFGKWYFGRPRP
jgi:hypothetical protein